MSETSGSASVELSVGASVPDAPTDVVAAAGDGQASIQFTPPVSDGGDPVVYYTATAYPGGQSASSTGSPITVAGLTNGTAYVFTVSATNNVGRGLESSPSSAVTPDGPSRLDPDPPPGSTRPGVAGQLASGRSAAEPAPRHRRVLGARASVADRSARPLGRRLEAVVGRGQRGLEAGVARVAVGTALDLAQHGRPFAAAATVIVQTLEQLVVVQVRRVLGPPGRLRRWVVTLIPT